MIIGKPTEKSNICGDRIREARDAQKISQEQLAARLQTEGLNINQNSVSRIETGKRLVADFELIVLSKVLNVDVKWLLKSE